VRVLAGEDGEEAFARTADPAFGDGLLELALVILVHRLLVGVCEEAEESHRVIAGERALAAGGDEDAGRSAGDVAVAVEGP